MKKADVILIAVVLAVAGILLFALYGFSSSTGSYVSIELDGEVTDVLPLDKDTTLEIETPNGTNTLIISDGWASVSTADCPDRLCVNQKKINRNGESIICLPHKLVISVTSQSTDDEIDGVA